MRQTQRFMHTSARLALLTLVLALPATAGEFPDDWYWERPEAHVKFEGRPAPALELGDWINGEVKPEDMKGRIIVLDFWATWCGPCIAAMPHTTELAKKYAGEGVKVIGVCTSGDPTQIPKIAKDNGAEYPMAVAQGDQVLTDWPVQWYPTYAVIDREGVVRAFGINPEKLTDVLETLLDDEAESEHRVRVRSEWLEGDPEKRARLQKLEDKADAPPALVVEEWINSEALTLEQLQGQVVLLDFWATWSPECLRKVEYHNKLMEQYADEGLVIIGVCASYRGEAMQAAIDDHGIAYPVCRDIENRTNTAYGPDGFPDYYLIDRAGRLRIADCSNAALEEAVVALLSEPAPDMQRSIGEAIELDGENEPAVEEESNEDANEADPATEDPGPDA